MPLLSTDAVFGAMQTPETYYFNVSMVTPYSNLDNLSQHPGFDIRPTFFCSNPNNLTPHSNGFFSIATSTGPQTPIGKIV